MNVSKFLIMHNANIREAIKLMDRGGMGFICVTNESNEVIGVVTDGDFRRSILNEVNLDLPIQNIINKNYKFLIEGYSLEEAKELFLKSTIRHIPILNKNKNLVEILIKEKTINATNYVEKERLDIDVVIMAGGKGTRLDPFTRILPKPLIPIGEKTILETIIEKFLDYHIDKFYISVNHKAGIIKSYFNDIQPNYELNYIFEDKPLGTIGALKQLENKIDRDILLTNCDILIDADYSDLIKHHSNSGNDITIVTSLKHYKIPYGICEIENGGQLIGIREKPEYDLLVNTGMYVLNPKVLKHIPLNEFFHITHLIDKIRNTHKIGVFPISENSWTDTGEWSEYKKAIAKVGF